jgi:hypothetical protein
VKWAKVETELWETEATDQQIAAYMRLMLWKVVHEHHSAAVPLKSGRGCPITQEEIGALSGSVLAPDGDLVHYPLSDIVGMQKAREAGKRGGRPKKGEGKNPRVISPPSKPDQDKNNIRSREDVSESKSPDHTHTPTHHPIEILKLMLRHNGLSLADEAVTEWIKPINDLPNIKDTGLAMTIIEQVVQDEKKRHEDSSHMKYYRNYEHRWPDMHARLEAIKNERNIK